MYRYLTYVPPGDPPPGGWPLLLYLHGTGECGESLRRVRRLALPRRLERGERWPHLVVAPQCPVGGRWRPSLLLRVLDEVQSRHPVDGRRVSATGISLGGRGVWDLALAAPDRLAALAPVCGWGRPSRADRIAHIPHWIHHGTEDASVPVRQATRMAHALREHGGRVRLSLYDGVGHSAWTPAYADPELPAWLAAQSRTG